MEKAIIGKVPGYNHKIDSSRIYEKKLLDNLTRVRLSPVGYKLNTDIFSSPISNDKDVYKIGENVGVMGNDSGTFAALKVWKQIQSIQNGQIQRDLKNEETNFTLDVVKTLEILSTNDSTLTENFSSSYGENSVEALTKGLANLSIGGVKVSDVSNLSKSVTSQEGLRILSKTDKKGLTELLAGNALKIQSALPKQWQSSDYNNQLQLMIKLVSPSGDQKSIGEYIIKPLTYLIMAAAPITNNGVFYGYPPLWKVEADGLMNMKIAGISNLSITRGGIDTQFNIHKQPLNIDVRLTLVPIVNGFASAYSENAVTKSTDTRLINTVSDMIVSF